MRNRHSLLAAFLFVSVLGAAPAFAVGNVVISQIYGAGGNASAVWRNDYIELFNRSGSPVNIGGWAVQYAATTGTSWAKTDIPTGTIIPAGGYMLIAEASGGANGTTLPSTCLIATGTISMAAGAGKVALTNNNTLIVAGTSCPSGAAVVDVVGYGTSTNCFEGAGPTGTINATTAAVRKGAGGIDTDSNSADFTVTSAVPCTLPTPTLGHTWGALKTIYR